MATHSAQAAFGRTNFMSSVHITDTRWRGQSDFRHYKLDLLDVRLYEIIRRISIFRPHLWTDTDKIEHISYYSYGTTSLYWVIWMYNGIIHPLEIEAGTTILIPEYGELSGILQEVRTKTEYKSIRLL